jgi:hypothetical protein
VRRVDVERETRAAQRFVLDTDRASRRDVRYMTARAEAKRKIERSRQVEPVGAETGAVSGNRDAGATTRLDQQVEVSDLEQRQIGGQDQQFRRAMRADFDARDIERLVESGSGIDRARAIRPAPGRAPGSRRRRDRSRDSQATVDSTWSSMRRTSSTRSVALRAVASLCLQCARALTATTAQQLTVSDLGSGVPGQHRRVARQQQDRGADDTAARFARQS